MKKVLTALVIAAVTAPVFAAFKHPGFTTKDMAKIDEAMATAKSPREKSIAIIMKNLATNQYPAFADFSNMVDKVVAENYITEKNMKKRDVVFLKKQFVLARGEYTESFWNFCKENPDFYDFYICKNKGFRKKYNISDKDCYTALVVCLFICHTCLLFYLLLSRICASTIVAILNVIASSNVRISSPIDFSIRSSLYTNVFLCT